MRTQPIGLAALALLLAGCPSGDPGAAPAGAARPAGASASSSAAPPPPTSQAGIPVETIARTLNPKGVRPYTGPTGTLRGTVRVSGDPPPAELLRLRPGCGAAAATYGKLFRVGQDDTLGDVLVAAAGYDAYVPPAATFQTVTITDCAYSTRTVGLTFGQHLLIQNRDAGRSYLPTLRGARLPAELVALPRGEVRLYAPQPGYYELGDGMGHEAMRADVFVLKYATFDVTGLDGRYEIPAIPVGKVQVNALLPAANLKNVQREIVIREGVNELDFTVPFDAEADAPKNAAQRADGGAPPPPTAAPTR